MPEILIDPVIRIIRHQKVILDFDLAAIYGVTTKRLNEQVARNRDRFPVDFMFRINALEAEQMWSQFATTSFVTRRRQSNLPYAFTEHGAVMAASVLRTPIAIEASVQVVRAFIQLRQLANSHADLARKIESLPQSRQIEFV